MTWSGDTWLAGWNWMVPSGPCACAAGANRITIANAVAAAINSRGIIGDLMVRRGIRRSSSGAKCAKIDADHPVNRGVAVTAAAPSDVVGLNVVDVELVELLEVELAGVLVVVVGGRSTKSPATAPSSKSCVVIKK